MRARILAVLCVLTACEERNGVYLVVDGEAAGIKFDRVEFFLGKDAGNETPFTPKHPYQPSSPTLPPTSVGQQRLIKRLFAESDVQNLSATTSFDYYLPADVENSYAHYVLIVASLGDQVVGLAEVEKFKVLDDAAYIYEIPLVPLSPGFERWGDQGEIDDHCVRWTRMREGDTVESTYAVIRSGDHDCDDVRETADCDDLNYCRHADTDACTERKIACIADSCAIGVCVDGAATAGTAVAKSCLGTTCLPASLCNPTDACREDAAPPEFLECAIKLDLVHTEVMMPVRSVGGPLCSQMYDVSFGINCVLPRIEWPPSGTIDGWTLSVVPNGTCQFSLVGPTVDASPPASIHALVSIVVDSTLMGRTTFVVGFSPATNGTGGCDQPFQQPPTVPEYPTCS